MSDKGRATVATTAILQIIITEPVHWLHHERAGMAGVREAIEKYLRDEFADVARKAAADRGDAS